MKIEDAVDVKIRNPNGNSGKPTDAPSPQSCERGNIVLFSFAIFFKHAFDTRSQNGAYKTVAPE